MPVKIRSHVRLAWFHLIMSSPYVHNPEPSAPQVMSPSITLGGHTGSGMAAQGPNYGGVDTGGAGGPAPDGGQARNRTMAEGQSLLNGVIGSQHPIAPGSRAVTTGSEVLEQPRGSGLPRRASSTSSSRPRMEFPDGSSAVNTGQRVDATTGSARDAATGSGANAGPRVDVTTGSAQSAPTGSGANAGQRVDGTTGTAQSAATGPGANAGQHVDTTTGSTQSVATGSDANVRRFQGETLGIRSRPGQPQPKQPAAAQPQQYNISTPPQQPAVSPEATAHFLPEGANALVALHARASRFVRAETMDGAHNAAAVEMGEVADANGEQMVWFTRIRGMLQRGLEFVRPLPSASPTSWYSQSPTWSLAATPTFSVPEAPRLPEQQQPRVGASSPGDHPGDQSSTGSLQPEVVQEEVRKAVQQAMQSRDTKVNELQAENAELKQLILAMIEANSSAGGVGGGIGPSAEGNRGAPTGRGEATGPPEGQRLPEQGDPRANREGDNRVFGAPPRPSCAISTSSR